ncbi:MAG: response regulator [Casimicrobiaceae bacterium]|nr:response regulator [Casimicrobiaceae bacterium]MCX8099068.1 response regulator [Casimicrobiaceae bacterium]MDW8312567.1 response regulator [Burkholderiales bacterium]
MRHSLMVVDDSMVFRNRIVRLITGQSDLGIQLVAMARDGVEAVELAQQKRPTLVTMDLTMPRMEGADCLRRLRDILPEARILVVSALSDRATALKAVACGAHGFLLKPFTDEELVVALRELLA